MKNAYVHACIPPVIIFLILIVNLFENKINIPFTVAVFVCGASGGVMSTYFRVKNIKNDTLEINAIIQIYITPLISGLLGWVAYSLFLSGIIEGSFFPKFKNQDGDFLDLNSIFLMAPKSTVDAIKSLLWSFVAGFSEKLIPNILDRISNETVLSK